MAPKGWTAGGRGLRGVSDQVWVLYLSGWSIAEIRDKLKKDFYTKGRIGTLLKPLKQHEDITKLEAKEQEKNQQWAQPCGAALNQDDEQEAAAQWPEIDDTTDESETESPPRWRRLRRIQ